MVLAQREDLNVLDYDKFIMVLVENGTIHNITKVLLISLCEEQQRFRVAFRCVQQTLSIGVFTKAFEYGPDSARQLGERFRFLLFGRLLSLARASTFWVVSGAYRAGGGC